MIIDLSNYLENDIPADPPGLGPRIEYINHTQGLPEMLAMFPGLRADQLPGGEAWGLERLQVTTHNGTHNGCSLALRFHHERQRTGVDHRRNTAGLVLPARREIRLRDKPHGHLVSPLELEEELKRIGHSLQPLEIVLMNTSAGAAYGTPQYIHSGCGFGREATLWLLRRGVRVVGTDGWSWDVPFSFTRERFARDQAPAIIWEGHKAGCEQAYCQLEKLANLDKLPPFGFTVSCFPFKIRGGSAGFTRAVALLP